MVGIAAMNEAAMRLLRFRHSTDGLFFYQHSDSALLKDQLERKLDLPRRRGSCSAADRACAVAQLAHTVGVERDRRARLAEGWSVE
jgi:hypothetical protein